MIPARLIRLFADEPPLSVADIGAAAGTDTINYAVAFPDARIYAFEPVPENLAYIDKTLTAQPDDIRARITVTPCALSDAEGEVPFYRSMGAPYKGAAPDIVDDAGDWRLSSSLLRPKDHLRVHPWCNFRVESARTIRLDAWAREHNVAAIDFVHMDVQGAELHVLRGAGDLLRTFKGVWLEVSSREMYEGQPLIADVTAFMEDRGFQLAYRALKPGAPQGDELWVPESRALPPT